MKDIIIKRARYLDEGGVWGGGGILEQLMLRANCFYCILFFIPNCFNYS